MQFCDALFGTPFSSSLGPIQLTYPIIEATVFSKHSLSDARSYTDSMFLICWRIQVDMNWKFTKNKNQHKRVLLYSATDAAALQNKIWNIQETITESQIKASEYEFAT